ncbi:hypothetical protein C2G38_2200053 [Gigaspora rosea]|uniref:Peptidase S1 domain-containing protein n=1 Tax=Gigaspora rosea TaxID=44941 RepID=A0A397UVA7_9GLOM|nr:hypothetical protein C2G38_2200053 [Gigaspora rosea]
MVHAGQNEPLAKLWDIDDEEIPKYLEIERTLINADKIINQELVNLGVAGTIFAGSYIDVKTNKTNINTIDQSKARNIINNSPLLKQYEAFISIVIVKKSYDELKNLLNGINELAKKREPFGIVVTLHVINNEVIITSCNYNKRFLRDAEKMGAIIVSSTSCGQENHEDKEKDHESKIFDEFDINFPVFGGDGLYIKHTDPDKPEKYSIGFWAICENNVNCVVTAGHCFYGYPPNTTIKADCYHSGWNNEPSDKIIGKSAIYITTPYDLAIIDASDINVNLKLRAAIRNTGSAYSELIINDGITVSTIGAHLCKSGYITHVSCGYLKTLEGFVINIFGDWHENMYFTSTPATSGDSGSPLFSFSAINIVILNGILAGSFGGDTTGFLILSTIIEYAKLHPVTE